MKKEEVPQDDANMLAGRTRELQYAVDESGRYTAVKSLGWEPKNIVLQLAWSDINEKLEEARKKVEAGQYSPLYYHMKKHLMNKRMLAKYAGISIIRVFLHLRPGYFKKMSPEHRERYKNVFDMRTDADLTSL